MSTTATPQAEAVQLPAPALRTVEIRLVGTSALIVHRWSDKAKRQMLDKQTKRASAGKAAKDPDQDYQDSLYVLPDEQGGGYGFPTVAFKAAAVRAGTYSELKMTFLRGAFHVQGEMAKIEGEPRPREDMVRIGMGVADIRYRAEFPQWSTTLTVKYNARAISLEMLLNLFQIAGFSVGVGEWRPEKDGSYGMFEVAS
jgi:hypothetical protein